MIDAVNRMSSQTAAFVLLVFASGFVAIAIFCKAPAAQLAVFGLSQNLVGGALLMLKATQKEVNTTNEAGSHVGRQEIASDVGSQGA